MAYPSTPVVFTTKTAGTILEAAHVNDLQTEVTALETALLTGGLAHNLNPATDNARALGSSGARWIISGSQITPESLPSTSLNLIAPAVVSLASTNTVTPDVNSTGNDVYTLTAVSTGVTFATPTGTPVDGQRLIFRVKDNGTAQTLTWSTVYHVGSEVSLSSVTSSGTWMYHGFLYSADSSRWHLLGKVTGF